MITNFYGGVKENGSSVSSTLGCGCFCTCKASYSPSTAQNGSSVLLICYPKLTILP